MEKEKQKQQGPISILNHIYVLQIYGEKKKKKKNRIRKGPRKNNGLVVSMLLILPDVIKHFKGP